MSARTVRHLRLRATDEAALRRVALGLEDALRTASLPEPGGRLVLVRRLALGRIPRDGAPQTLALILERRIAALGAACVSACHPAAHENAGEAPAVWFRDALEAHAALALRLLAGEPADAWYWPLAVPAWRRGQPLPEALRGLVHSVAALPEAAVALPLWVAAVIGAGHGEQLLAALDPADMAALARAAGIVMAPDARTMRTPAAGEPAPAARMHSTARTAESPPRPADPRRSLLRALLAAAATVGDDSGSARPDHAASAGDAAPAAPSHADAALVTTLAHGSQARPEPSLSPSDDPSITPPSSHPQQSRPLPRRRAQRARPARLPQPDGPARPATFPAAAPLSGPAFRRAGGGASPWAFGRRATRAGGLLFVLRVLDHLGYPAWLAAQPEWARVALPRRLFAEILGRLRLPPDDPAWTLAGAAPLFRTPRRFVAPAAWHGSLDKGAGPLRHGQAGDTHVLWDAAGRLPLGVWQGPCPRRLLRAWRGATRDGGPPTAGILALALRAWLTATRRWLRRHAGIGIADLVRRPAELTVTPTHVDLFFGLEQADLRLRRPGLDLDPGWLPWLGQVVNFHYSAAGEA